MTSNHDHEPAITLHRSRNQFRLQAREQARAERHRHVQVTTTSRREMITGDRP